MRDADGTVHVFWGRFGSEPEALRYTTPQWAPEPDDSASDDEYAAWEATNPTHLLARDLGVYLDEDFVETVFGPGRFEYLDDLLVVPDASRGIRETTPGDSDTLVLVFDRALDDTDVVMKSTVMLTYAGAHVFTFAKL